MRVLVVSNQIFADDRVTNPILERMRVSLLRDKRVDEVTLFPVGYSFKGLKAIRAASRKHDIVHVHFGGVYALIVWVSLCGVHCPKLITFHGTDIHAQVCTSESILTKLKIKINQLASFLSILAFHRVGFVANEMKEYVPKCLNRSLSRKSFVQSLGVDYHLFQTMPQAEAQQRLCLKSKNYALFSSISNMSIKRQDIAEAIVEHLGDEYELLVMCGVKPYDVPLYINACNFLLLTSDEEGSPNIIRECLALNKPVFSVDVGDAALQLTGLTNSCIIERDPQNAARIISMCLQRPYVDNTREMLKARLDFDTLSNCIVDMYEQLLPKRYPYESC